MGDNMIRETFLSEPNDKFPVYMFEGFKIPVIWVNKISNWCEENCDDLWEIHSHEEGISENFRRIYIWMIKEEDAAAFKLAWT